jgi:AcrR family transcriptional regulator
MMNKTGGRGRPAGDSDARERILEAGRRMFFAAGYRGVTMRAIAAEAGVDAALISYHYGSKRGLFAAVMRLAINPADIIRRSLPGARAQLPERIITNVLAAWDDPVAGEPLITLYRSAGSDPDASRLVRELIEREILEVLSDYLGGPGASARAAIAASQIAGLLFMRHVLRTEPLGSMPASDVALHAGPAMRAALFARHRYLPGGTVPPDERDLAHPD